MDAPKLTGLKKRQQIQQANKTMFIWVIAAAVAVTICLVLAQFMVRQLMVNNKIIGEKVKAQTTLDQNVKSFESLKKEVIKLTANESLTGLRVADTDTALQVVIDALPTIDDRATLGTSLQQVILAPSGITIKSLDVTQGVTEDVAGTEVASSTAEPQAIAFQMIITGTYDQIATAVKDMERSIRPIVIDSVKVQGTGRDLQASITAKSYYLPGKSVEVTKKTLKP